MNKMPHQFVLTREDLVDQYDYSHLSETTSFRDGFDACFNVISKTHLIAHDDFKDLAREYEELKNDCDHLSELLTIAEKYIAMSNEATWDAYIEEILAT